MHDDLRSLREELLLLIVKQRDAILLGSPEKTLLSLQQQIAELAALIKAKEKLPGRDIAD